MNNISEQLLQAMDIIVDQKISQLEFDKTIQAIIYKVENADTGEYKVRYNGNIFSAFAIDLTQTYKENDAVFVTVPEGNFSNKKLITDLVSAKSLSYNQLAALQNSILEVSPQFQALYGDIYNPELTHGVIAGAPENSSNSYAYIYQGPEKFQQNGYHGLFQQYAAKYKLIRIKASFLTQLLSEHEKGNYGIRIEFYSKTADDIEVVSYDLDLNSFNGDPYHYSVYSPQSVIIKTQLGNLLGLKSIKLFEKDFEYDRIIENGLVTDKKNTTVPNIFVKDIALNFVEQKDLSDTEYYLTISTPNGIAFTENISSLSLIGRIIHQGKDIMNSNDCKCKWFIQDISITQDGNGYNSDAGIMWRQLQNTSDNLALAVSDVTYQQKYKLLVTYKETISLSAEVEVYNNINKSKYDFSIAQATEGEDIKLFIENNLNSEVLIGDWYLSYPNGTYLQLTNGKKQNSVVINEYLKYDSVTFYCGVYDSQLKNILSIVEYTMTTSQSQNDVSISFVGRDIFRYDTNGDIAIDEFEEEKTLQISLVWAEGIGTGYSVSWIMRDDEDNEVILSNQKYRPQSSMINQVWVDNSNILHYNIKEKYKLTDTNNIFTIKISTITGEEYYFNKEILFLKDGDQGTNGTTYILTIRPCDNNENKLSGFQPLIYNNGWKNTLKLKCYIYKDGLLINNNSKFTITYKWKGINVTILGANPADLINIQGSKALGSSSADLQFYVKIQVDINDSTNGRKISLYATYPVDIAVGGIDISKINISTIPSYIKYSASGVKPVFSNQDIKFIYNKQILKNKITSLNKKLLDIETRNELDYLRPASSFIFEDIKKNNESNVGVLKISYNDSQYIIHPVIMYLDNYGNEAINGWDGTALEIDDKGQYIFAPQMGAGEKDSQNRFTGVVMGKDSTQNRTGLYGYQAGENVFGIMDDGRAYFGAKSGGGQIILDGKVATLYGGDVTINSGGSPQSANNGMYLILAKKSDTDKAICIGKDKFWINYKGDLTANSATIVGNITANILTANKEGNIAGWTIASNRLSSGGSKGHIALDSTPISDSNSASYFAIWAGSNNAGKSYNPSGIELSERIDNPAPFVVTKDGFVYMKNAYIKGTIEATSGNVGGWKIAADGLQDANGTIYLSTSKGLKVGSNFSVTQQGVLTVKSANVTGDVTATNLIANTSGQIAGWQISAGRLSNDSNSIYLDVKNGLKFLNKFTVDAEGKLTASDANITGTINAGSGKIGGWTIEQTRLSSKNARGTSYIALDSSTDQDANNDDDPAIWAGSVQPANAKFSVSKKGVIKAVSGTIGGFTLADNLLSVGLSDSGYIGISSNYNNGGIWLGNTDASNAPFHVNRKGEITAKAGKIADWNIEVSQLYGENTVNGKNYKVRLSANKNNLIYAGELSDSGAELSSYSDNKSFFAVTREGQMICSSAKINGTISAIAGKIGGWSIEQTQLINSSKNVGLKSDSNSYFSIWAGASSPGKSYTVSNSLSSRIDSPAPFVVTKDGYVYMKNAYVKGTISSVAGDIGGWSIANNKIYSNITGKYNVGLSSSGKNVFWVGNTLNEESNVAGSSENPLFVVTRQGKMICSNAEIKGNVTATKLIATNEGNIAGWKFDQTSGITRLVGGTNEYTVGLDSTPINESNSTSYFAIWTGKRTPGSSYSASKKLSERITSPAPFVVTKDGFVYMSNVCISGNCEINGTTIAKSIFSGQIEAGSDIGDSFKITSEGIVGVKPNPDGTVQQIVIGIEGVTIRQGTPVDPDNPTGELGDDKEIISGVTSGGITGTGYNFTITITYYPEKVETRQGRPGSTIHIVPVTREGYDFTNWTVQPENSSLQAGMNISTSDSGILSFTMPECRVNITANWEESAPPTPTIDYIFPAKLSNISQYVSSMYDMHDLLSQVWLDKNLSLTYWDEIGGGDFDLTNNSESDNSKTILKINNGINNLLGWGSKLGPTSGLYMLTTGDGTGTLLNSSENIDRAVNVLTSVIQIGRNCGYTIELDESN